MGYGAVIKSLGRFIPGFFRSVPASFTFILVFISLLGSLVTAIQTGDPLLFFSALGKKILAADFALAETMKIMAEGNHGKSHTYLLMDSLSNILLLYYMVKYLSKLLKNIIGKTGSPYGFILISMGILGLIEMAVAGVTEQQLVIPYHGLFQFLSSPDILFGPYVESYNSFIETVRTLEEQNKTIFHLFK